MDSVKFVSDSIIDPSDPLRHLLTIWVNLTSSNNIYLFIGGLILIWFILEIIFFILLERSILPSLKPPKKPLPYYSCPIQLIERILNEVETLETYSLHEFVSGFFLKAKIDDIYSDNIRSFLCWVTYGVKEKYLSEEEKKNVSKVYDKVCKKCSLKPKEGYNPSVNHICISWENVTYIHRPLIIYVWFHTFDIIVAFFAFRLRGYRHFEISGLKYWYHPGHSIESNQDPLIFFHGITPGWLAYLYFIYNISYGRPAFLVNVDGIKIKSLEFTLPTPQKFAHTVNAMLHRHHYSKASLVGHSFGTITAGWFLKFHPEMVRHVTLIDPVSLLLSLPDVAYNFVYRKPSTIIEWIIHIFASTELTISHAIRRNFYWYVNVLWLDEIPSDIGVVIAIGGNDEIINSKTISEYSRKHKQRRLDDNSSQQKAPIEVLEFPEFSHGQILLPCREQKCLIEAIELNEKNTL